MTNPILHLLDADGVRSGTSPGETNTDWDFRVDLGQRLLDIGASGAFHLFLELADERPDDVTVERQLLRAYELTLEERAAAPSPTDALLQAMTLLADARRLHSICAYEGAEKQYRSALALVPESTAVLLDLSQLLLRMRRSEEAIELAQRLSRIDPGNVTAYLICGDASANLGMAEAALKAYRKALELDPGCAAAQLQLGIILRRTGQQREALKNIKRAATQLTTAHAYIELGAALRDAGCMSEADEAFARAHDLQPLKVYPASSDPPAFVALMLWAPGRANTPIAYFIEQASYECRMLGLISGRALNYHHEQQSVDVVVNLIADADQAGDLLPLAADAVAESGRAVINHPQSILQTDRRTISRRLAGIRHCHVPQTESCDREKLLAAIDGDALFGIQFPVLLRPAGTHGGDALECVSKAREVADFVRRFPADTYYVTAFVDYRSPDSHFRKYRMVIVDGEIFPYHLAIGDDWKVHHYRTRMADNAWMQEEEAAFLSDPGTVFAPEHIAAFGKIRDIVDLGFFGIDCALDADGKLLIFEVNACMLIEPDDSHFGFKLPYNEAVKSAFTRMLARAATAFRTRCADE